MKNPLVVLAFVCLLGNLSAQFKLGVRSNFALSTTISAERELSNFEPLELMNAKMMSASNSFSYGLALYSENDKLFFMAEALYRKDKLNFELENLVGDFRRNEAQKEFSYTTSSIHVPISAGVKIKNFKIGGGPVFNYRLDSTNNLTDVENIQSTDKKLSTGFAFLVGYVLKDHIHIDLKREMNFDRSGSNYSYRGEPFKLKSSPTYMSLSLGVFF